MLVRSLELNGANRAGALQECRMDVANLRIASAADRRGQLSYAISGRRIRRAEHVPPGRALHILDLENLCAGPERIPQVRELVADSYRQVANVTTGDHVVIGVNPNSLVSSAGVFPGCRFVAGHGPDGADLALLKVVEDVDWVAHRFDRVVIGSGDHCFAPAVTSLARRGLIVLVVSQQRCLSRDLASAATAAFCLSVNADDYRVA